MAYFADGLPNTGVSAKDQMRWQEFMSDTAHQREMEDLRRAGLNPVLSAGGSGASTPSGSQDSSETLALLKGMTELVKASHNSAKSYTMETPSTDEDIAKLAEDLYGDAKMSEEEFNSGKEAARKKEREESIYKVGSGIEDISKGQVSKGVSKVIDGLFSNSFDSWARRVVGKAMQLYDKGKQYRGSKY